MKKFLSSLSTPILLLFTVLLGLAPFRPEPHLVEKFRMLSQGTLTRPLDIFDLVFHLVPTFLLLAKLAWDPPWKRG